MGSKLESPLKVNAQVGESVHTSVSHHGDGAVTPRWYYLQGSGPVQSGWIAGRRWKDEGGVDPINA